MPTLLDTFAEVVAHAPGRIFAFHVQEGAETRLTYEDLLRQAWGCRCRLAANGLRPGDIVLIVLKHHPAQYAWFLGAMLLGAIPSFMPFRTPKQDPALYWSSHRALLDRIGARALVTWADNLGAIAQHLEPSDKPLTVLTVEEDSQGDLPSLESALAGLHALPRNSDDTAFLQHSSGTTGLKKGVMLSHRAVLRQVSAYREAIGLEPSHRLASWLPLYHDMGLIACYVMPLVTGCSVVSLDPFEWVVRPTLLLDAMERHACHFAWLPNFAFHHLARSAPEGASWDLRSVVALINCSEPCKPQAFEAFMGRFRGMGLEEASLQVCYAMAETVFAVTQTQPRSRVKAIQVDPAHLSTGGRIRMEATGLGMLSCGKPLPGTRVEIRGDQGELLPEDRVGEVTVAAPFLFDGYFRLPETTADRLRAGIYRTGDLGFLHDGELYISGRKDDQIIVYGQNFFAHDIEACLDGLEGVLPGRRVAVGRANAAQGSQEVVVILETAADAHPAGLRKAAKQRVLDGLGLMLSEVAMVSPGWLVKTTSGKLSREANLLKLMDAKGSQGDA